MIKITLFRFHNTLLIIVSFQIFEWWYFKKYGTSFIEQISLTHISPLLGGNDDEADSENGETNASQTNIQGDF